MMVVLLLTDVTVAQTRTFTATDGCNNTSTTSRTVRWIADVTPPAFTGSYADVNLGCNPANPGGSLGLLLQLMHAVL